MKCTYCGHELEVGTGVLYVKKDGSSSILCSRKCRINQLDLKRDKKKFKWTIHYKKAQKT